MELDDLKKGWQLEQGRAGKRDILKMIRSRSEGPAARLRRRFRNGMFILSILTVVIVRKLSDRHGLIFGVLTWYLIGFCLLMFIYFFLNYRLMGRMQVVEEDVRNHLRRQVQLLRKGLYWRLLITRTLFASLFLLLELLMYLKKDEGFDSWAGRPLLLRLAVYAGVFAILYYFTKKTMNHRYKKHIEALDQLVHEME
jgi:Na+/melibiose symporter-like transporter